LQDDDTSEAGFTLLEVIIAFAITSLSLTVLFQTFSGGLGAIRASQMKSQVAFLARSKLAEFETQADRNRPLEGRSGQMTWKIEKTQHLELSCAAWLRVKVSWPGQRNELQMTTLIFQASGCR